MGGDYYYCPHCSKAIPFDDIRKKLDQQYDLRNRQIKEREDQLAKEHSNWEQQFKGYMDTTDSTKYYDIIICIESLLGIESGWKVKSCERGKQLYEKMKNEPIVKVGVIGLRNKGKSFLLNKFLKKSLPKGTSIKTEGLSIKYPSESDLKNQRNYILLDSAGSEVPLLDYEKKLKKLNREEAFAQLEIIAKDKTLTELFLQKFIISSCDMLCLVVGVLTYPEQKLLNRIEKTLKTLMNTNKIYKKLFVIHNLESFVEKEQVEDYIREYLKNSATFELKENNYIKTGNENKKKKNQNNKYYVETFDTEDETPLQVFHLIMANDFSNAGEYYNDFTIDYLKEHLNSFTNIKSFPVIEKIKESFIQFSEEAFENPIHKEDITIADDLTIKLNPEKKILFKKCFIDEMGFSNFFASGFEPNYWIYKDKEKINITFESSGTVKEIEPNCEYIGDRIIFSISGNKEIKIPEENEDVKIFQNSIKQGKFNFQIKLPNSNDIKLQDPDDPEFEKGSTEKGTGGIYTFSYKLSKKDKKKKVYE